MEIKIGVKQTQREIILETDEIGRASCRERV